MIGTVGAIGVVGKDMVRFANQSYVVRFAHGLLPALVPARVLDRRWRDNCGLYLYSRPYVYLHPRTRVIVYSRPRAESGESAASSPGCHTYAKRSGRPVMGTGGFGLV